jgi:hypothetical protein
MFKKPFSDNIKVRIVQEAVMAILFLAIIGAAGYMIIFR